jgi:hypothetical protein
MTCVCYYVSAVAIVAPDLSSRRTPSVLALVVALYIIHEGTFTRHAANTGMGPTNHAHSRCIPLRACQCHVALDPSECLAARRPAVTTACGLAQMLWTRHASISSGLPATAMMVEDPGVSTLPPTGVPTGAGGRLSGMPLANGRRIASCGGANSSAPVKVRVARV